MYAAIGTNGIRDIVWGLGESAEAAEEQAREGLREDGTPDIVELRTQEVSAGDVAAVNAGDVDADRLGRR